MCSFQRRRRDCRRTRSPTCRRSSRLTARCSPRESAVLARSSWHRFCPASMSSSGGEPLTLQWSRHPGGPRSRSAFRCRIVTRSARLIAHVAPDGRRCNHGRPPVNTSVGPLNEDRDSQRWLYLHTISSSSPYSDTWQLIQKGPLPATSHDRLKRAGLSTSRRRGFWQLTDDDLALAAKHPSGLPDDVVESLLREFNDVRLVSRRRHDVKVQYDRETDTMVISLRDAAYVVDWVVI